MISRDYRVVRFLRASLLAIFPTILSRYLVYPLGYRIAYGARVGFSWIDVDMLRMSEGTRIKHLNRISGPFALILDKGAQIGSFNTIRRAKRGVSIGDAALVIGDYSGLTASHKIDLTCSIIIGKYSTIAGSSSQFWTHGYVHDLEGIGRYRLDGPITIGDNVYIGSMVLVSMGVRIANGVVIGGGASIASDLLEPGLYVSSSLRCLPRPLPPDRRSDLIPLDSMSSEDRVYIKKRNFDV